MGLRWEQHEILKPPTDEEMAKMEPAELIRLHDLYHQAISNSRRDPYRYGWKLPQWKDAEDLLTEHSEILVSGGNRSAKTTWAALACVRAAVENPNSVVMCFSQNADVSIRQQQSAIWDALPEELRAKVLGTEENVSYTRKNGFSKNSLILPGSKSLIIFKTYAQFLNNDTILEGAELGSREPTWLNVGAWCDEYLIGPELLATLRFRLATRNAKLVVTFTPIDGYTEVVRDYLQGATTVRNKSAELLGGRTVPYIQKSRNRDAGIIYFHSKDNPFGGYERIAKDLIGRPDDEVLTRAYGVPTKSISSKFPNFSREVNVMKHEGMKLKGLTHYMVLDPAGRKNWFMVWIAVDQSETWFVYREWPDVNVGEWARWHGGKWIPGQGAKGLGYGIRDYVDLITTLESEIKEPIMTRLIDPRLGAAKYQTQSGASSIIEDLADAGLVFEPAPGLDIEDGIQALQTKMAYKKEKPVDSLNRPHFYISDRCENLIQALQEYTGEGGPDEAWKDPCDCYDDETEILTKTGWVKFCDLGRGHPVATMSEDGFLEWQIPSEYHKRWYEGELVCADSASISFAVTPNHRMLVYPQKASLRFRLASEIFRQDTFPVVTNGLRDSDDGVIEVADGLIFTKGDWAEFLGWYVAEGFATGTKGGKIQVPGRGYRCGISQSRVANPEKCKRIEALLDKMEISWSYRDNTYLFSNQALWTELFPLGNSYEKRLPDYVWDFPRSALVRMYDAMILGDGWVSAGTSTYATVSPKLADQVTVLMQLIGVAQSAIYSRMVLGRINGRDVIPTTPVIHVPSRKRRRSTVTTKDKRMLVHRRLYAGNVYCVSVPNTTLVVRRNGLPLVCGNCLRYAAIDGIRFIDPKSLKTQTRKGSY